MTYKSKPKIIFAVSIVLLAATAINFLIFRPSPKADTQAGGQTQSKPLSTQAAYIQTENFTYLKPTGWAKLAKERLDSNGAVSGVGRTSAPAGFFTIKVSSSAPRDNNELKTATLAELRKLAKFEFLHSESTTVGGKTGQRFTYRFGDKDIVKQDLSVVFDKQRTFFLLFSSSDADFDKQKAELDSILSSFKFK